MRVRGPHRMQPPQGPVARTRSASRGSHRRRVLARGGRCGHVAPRGAIHVRAASHGEGWSACARDGGKVVCLSRHRLAPGQELVGSDGDATTRRQGRPDRSDTAAPPLRVGSRTSNCPSAALLPAGDSISIIVRFRSQSPDGKRFRLDGITVKFLSQTRRRGLFFLFQLLFNVLPAN